MRLDPLNLQRSMDLNEARPIGNRNPAETPLTHAPAAGPGEYWRWCPRCGHELHNDHCKLKCPKCHYFMSCSDFD